MANQNQIASEADVVDVEQVESAIEHKAIGERIRRLRIKRSMGLVELGKRSGLSASFLSQLETGRVVPTVRNLARIAMIFNKDLSYFFREEAPVHFRILRRNQRVRLERALGASGIFQSENLSSLISDGSMVPCIAHFHATKEPLVFRPRIVEGIEFTFVIEGTLNLTSETESHTLKTGDVAWLDAVRPREYSCPAGQQSRAIIITRPQRN